MGDQSGVDAENNAGLGGEQGTNEVSLGAEVKDD